MAMICAYLVQDLSGRLDLGLARVFWVTLGLAVNQSRRAAATGRDFAPHALSLTFVGIMALVCVYLLADGYARLRADSHLFEAQSPEVRTQWPEVESRVSNAHAALPSDSRTEMMSAQLYANRFLATREPAAYARSHALFEASYAHNPFDRMRLVNVIALETNALQLDVTSKGSDFAGKAL
jgi:hypothetical protein